MNEKIKTKRMPTPELVDKFLEILNCVSEDAIRLATHKLESLDEQFIRQHLARHGNLLTPDNMPRAKLDAESSRIQARFVARATILSVVLKVLSVDLSTDHKNMLYGIFASISSNQDSAFFKEYECKLDLIIETILYLLYLFTPITSEPPKVTP